MTKHLEEAVLRCDTCARFRHQQRREPLMSTSLPERPWQHVGSDLLEIEGKRYLLIVDYYSRFPEQCRSGSSATMALSMPTLLLDDLHSTTDSSMQRPRLAIHKATD